MHLLVKLWWDVDQIQKESWKDTNIDLVHYNDKIASCYIFFIVFGVVNCFLYVASTSCVRRLVFVGEKSAITFNFDLFQMIIAIIGLKLISYSRTPISIKRTILVDIIVFIIFDCSFPTNCSINLNGTTNTFLIWERIDNQHIDDNKFKFINSFLIILCQIKRGIHNIAQCTMYTLNEIYWSVSLCKKSSKNCQKRFLIKFQTCFAQRGSSTAFKIGFSLCLLKFSHLSDKANKDVFGYLACFLFLYFYLPLSLSSPYRETS